MNPQSDLDHALAYFNAQLHRPRGLAAYAQPPCRFVTLSRETGAGSGVLARNLRDCLNAVRQVGEAPWTVFDRDLIKRLLTDLELSPHLARFLPEAAVSELDSTVGEIMGAHPNLWELTQRMIGVMREMASRGQVILIGRGANFATRGIPGGCHVRLLAPLEFRAERIAKLLDLDDKAAREHCRRTDAERAAYVRRVYDADAADLSSYDMILNTSRIPPEVGARLIAEALKVTAVAQQASA